MQTSQVFNQKAWPGAGDVDDCWVISSIQAVNAALPWLSLPTVPTFREAAGKPDRPGQPDGGDIGDVVKGITQTFPVLAGHLRVLKAVPWAALVAEIDAHRPVTLAVKSMYLPQRLQYNFGGYHQVTVAKQGERYLFANPLAPDRSRWDVIVSPIEIQEAVLRYGADTADKRCVYAVALPDDAEALRLHPLFKTEVTAAATALAAPLVEEAHKAGYADARTKAVAAVSSI